ncbi:MAG: hypothetical protein NZT61_06160 [Deltaproteobacteria bacterium]|nr:hypothetical protein [Deltaproteobacteria bacterium]MCX7952914.1 hypothetical protein [Deltaproteobacteria bacterium]
MFFEHGRRNPFLSIIPEKQPHPDLKIPDFRAKVKTYLEIIEESEEVLKEMLEALNSSFNTFYEDDEF